MDKRELLIVRDGAPFSLVCRLQGHEQLGLYLLPGTVEALRALLERSGSDGQENFAALTQLLENVVAPHRAATAAAAADIKTAMEEVRRMAEQLNGGGDGPRRA